MDGVHDGAALPERPTPTGSAGELERRPEWPVDRHRGRGLDLTPEELVARRHNRRLLVGIVVPSVVVLGLALLATATFWNNEPSGPHLVPPAGYKAVSDGYVAYAVPVGWTTNPAFTDDAGDLDTSGPDGWVGEHRAYRLAAPVPGETPPTSLQAFGMARAEPLTLADGRPAQVKGATVAYTYTATHPGGFRATVVDVWSSRSGVEVWLMVRAPDTVTRTILSSLED